MNEPAPSAMGTTTSTVLHGVKATADYAAAQSDRWLFVASLVVFCLAFFIAAWWLTNQFQRMMDRWQADMTRMQSKADEQNLLSQTQIATLHTERIKAVEAYAMEIRQIHKEYANESRELAKSYTTAIAKAAEVMGEVRVALRDLQSNCAVVRGTIYGGIGHQVAQKQRHSNHGQGASDSGLMPGGVDG